MVDEDFIKKMIEANENRHFDRKLKITSKFKIAKTISAFSNTEGGTILVGVSDEKRIVGIDPEEEIYMISSANDAFCLPPAILKFEEYLKIDFNEESNEVIEKSLLLVHIKKSEAEKIFVKLPAGGKKAYHRINDRTMAME